MKKLPWTPVEMKKTFTQNEVVRFFMLLMFILQFGLLHSQECLFNDDEQMPPPERMEGIYESKNGFALSPHGTIRVLVVFAEINYDTGTDPNPTNTSGWNVGSLPVWANDLFDPNISQDTPTGLISRYYHEASLGNYNVLGDYVLAPDNGGIFKVNNSQINLIGVQKALIQQVNSVMNENLVTGHNLNNISYFDNWTKMGSGKPKITPSTDTPPKYDNVIFIFRNRPNLNGTGSASSAGFATQLLGYSADTYISIGTYSDIPTKVLRHEYAHLLFGGNNFHCSGGGWNQYLGGDYFIPQTGGWSALSLAGASLLSFNAWDRQRLDWKNTNNLYNPSARNSSNTAEVNGDLDGENPLHAGIYILRDFITTGDAIRIKLPFTDPVSEFPTYLWLENHNGTDMNGSPFDQWQYQDQCIFPFNYGLMAYIQVDREIRSSTNHSDIYGGYADYLSPLTADGHHDLEHEPSTVTNDCIGWGPTRAFTKSSQNPLTGCSGQNCSAIDIDSDHMLIHTDHVNNFVELQNGVYYKNLIQYGHTSHIFDITGNHKIGMGTNPSSSNLMNLVGHDFPSNNLKNLRKIYLNGLSIEILSQNTDGTIKINIKFDDTDVDNNVRWCADEIVLNSISSNSGYSLNLKTGKSITLDQGTTATRMRNPQTYNGKEIFVSPTLMRIKDEAVVHLEPYSEFIIKNGSELLMESGSRFIVENGARLIVEEGSILTIKDCSSLIVNGSGSLLVKDGGILQISPEAMVFFANGDSNYELENGFIIPQGYVNPSTISFPGLTINSSINVGDKTCYIPGNLTIENGGTLTLSRTTLRFDELNGKLIVKRGGKLIINDASLLMQACGDYWNGIEVQGNSNVAQTPSTNQGVLIINGGTIENAECGIRTWKPLNGTNTPDPNYYGGLVMATDANFVNNIVAVEILPYSFANYGFFKKCNFITNAALPNGKYPDYFVKLNGISNISFKGCLFENTYQNEGVSLWGSGIYAYDANVFVDHECISNTVPCSDYLKSTFKGLYRGIYALGSSRQRNTVVHNSEFKNTFRGMYLGNIDFASIKRNDFEAIGEVPGLNAIGYGLYLDASTAFAIEENYFHSPTSIRKGIGLIINEAGPDNNEVYNNRFENLQNGSIAQGYNRQSGGSVDGLCYKCNDFINNATDIRISPRSIRQLTNSDGIAYHQGANIPGDNLAPAGNTFTTTSNLKDINNTCNWIIYYRHHYGPASLLPNPADLTTNYQVFGTTYNKTISCPSRIGTGTGKEETRLAMEGAESQASDVQSSLDALIDGGSTPELHQEVINSTPDEGLLLRNQLLADSPYLSDTILKTSINKEEVLNNAMIRDVLVANPQSAKSAQMVEMIDGRIVPMTDEMKNEVLSGQTTTSSKESLEATLSSYKHEVWVNFVNLCNLYAGDTLHTWQSDTMGVLLAGANTPGTRYQLAFWQLFKGNPATAQQVMGNIPSEFTLDAGEQALHNRYATLLNELIAFDNNPEMLLEPGTDIYEALMELSNSGEDKPAALSRNLLLSAGLIEYDEPIKLDDGLKTMPVYKPGVQAAQSQKLKVYPNPANTFVTVSWYAPEQGNTTLVIHDANGRKVLTRPLQGLHNETIVDITGFVQGTYTVSLSQGGKTIATETLVIAK